MIRLPASIAQAARATSGEVPVVELKLWAYKGPHGELSTQGDWKGLADPDVGLDVNMDFTAVPGAAVLAPGSTVGAVYIGPDSKETELLSPVSGPTYRWQATSRVKYPWTAGGSLFVNDIVIRTKTWVVGNRNPINASGVYRQRLFAWIEDQAGNIVGKAASADMAFGWNTVTISGLKARVLSGRRYFLVLQASIFHGIYDGWQTHYTAVYSYSAADPWAIPGKAGKWSIGGQAEFQASGSMKRRIDLGETPTTTGTLTIQDVVPMGTSLTITLEYSDDGTAWTSYGTATDGMSLPAHRFWRFSVSMTSTPANDASPELHAIRVDYRPSAVTLTSRGRNRGDHVVISDIQPSSAQLAPKVQKAMVGQITVDIMPGVPMDQLASLDLKFADVEVFGTYLSTPDDQVKLYRGHVHDLRWSREHWQLVLTDYIELGDAQVPSTSTGSVWDNADYSPSSHGGTRWHLAEVAEDILLNRVNLRSSMVDTSSIREFMTTYPNRTCDRVITKPVKAAELLAEIAWLLEAQWVVRDGKLGLVREPSASWPAVDVIDDSVIGRVTGWRRGWDNVKNICLIWTGYSGDGNDSTQFTGGEAYSDPASVSAYGPRVEVFKDKWSLPTATIQTIAQSVVNRWKNGRQVLRCSVPFSKLHLEPGDRVTLQTDAIPTGGFEAMVIQRDLHWAEQTINLTLMEVTA